jgi:hypothetical protein
MGHDNWRLEVTMESPNKIRVAVPSGLGALALVKVEVAAALGAVPSPELQELECGQIVVEMKLPEASHLPSTPSDLAQEIARGTSNLEVLSAWHEPTSVPPAPKPPAAVLRSSEVALSLVAVRALADNLPTSTWRAHYGHWTLGVPFPAEDGTRSVAISQRRGYSRRFSSLEVAATRQSLHPAF